jgi:hypothetical protein
MVPIIASFILGKILLFQNIAAGYLYSLLPESKTSVHHTFLQFPDNFQGFFCCFRKS